MPKTNLEVKIFRNSAPTGLGSDSALELVDSRVPVWLQFNRSTTFTSEGLEVITDGTLKISSAWDIKDNDVVELQEDPTKRYRIESLREVYSAAGSVIAQIADLVRDTSLE